MEHFADERWADFVREAGSQEGREEMLNHLSAGCNACQESFQFWQGVAAASSREPGYEPPAAAVRIAKSLVLGLTPGARSTGFSVADLIADSRLLGAAAGVRSGQNGPRQLLFISGTVKIDVRIESVPESTRMWIAGQIVDFSTPDRAVPDATVSALSPSGQTEDTKTNEFGEFDLEIEEEPRVRLSLKILGKNEIWVPLRY